jgi:uncharacterized membrane protein
MADESKPTEAPEALPFVAPCRKLPRMAAWHWLQQGFADLRSAPLQSLTYGLFMSLLIMLVSALAWQYGSAWILFSMLCGFVFVAPLSCIGIYAISAQLERNEPVSMIRTLRAAFKRHLGTEMVFALVLLIVFLVWARAASVASIFLPDTTDPGLTELLGYIIAGSVVGAIFFGITFSASVFSLPMIMHRQVDAITAVLTSINAVLRNKTAMLVWFGMILAGLMIGVATAGLALIIFLPAVGHAVWHGYLETIDASAFPRHTVGITSVARPGNQPK